MAFLQKEFEKFHDSIKLRNIDHTSSATSKKLREKRDMLVNELREWGRKNDKPTFDEFDQGSYAMSTGIKPLNSDDYDIDEGIIYDIDVADYDDPVKVKEWVYTALNTGNRTVEIKSSCVRVQYHKGGEEDYHVDFAIYGKKYDEDGNIKNLCLAKGKTNSSSQDKFWEDAEPKKLKKLINEQYSEEEKRRQFKKIIRYLKRWKDENFSSGDARPTGIAMTAMAYNWFEPEVTKWNGVKDKNDLKAIKKLVKEIEKNNYGLDVCLPVKPGNELLKKMKQKQQNIKHYKDKITTLKDVLIEASDEPDPHEAAKKLRKVFGDDFPVPEKEDTAVKTFPPFAPSSGNA